MRGILLILSGPSAVGKDAVIDAWRTTDRSVQRVVACTTRSPRTGEIDGIDYHFISKEEFERRIPLDYFLEHKEVFDHMYGTPRDEVDRLLAEGQVAVLKIDVEGAKAVMAVCPDVESVFLMPPNRDELRGRIEKRSQDSEDQIQLRLAKAEAEMAEARHYRHVIVNDRVDRVVNCLKELTAR